MRNLLRSCALALLWLAALTRLAAQTVGDQDLYKKSLGAAEAALSAYGPIDDPAEMRRVAEIGYRIAMETGFTRFPFTFHLVDMPEPNAFALPGGQIFVTRGMLDLGLTDDMLAALLGHEIAHVVEEHGTRMQKRATLLNVLSQVLVAGAMIGASKSGGSSQTWDPYGRGSGGGTTGEVLQGAAAAGVVVTELLLRSHSREFEDEADEEGQRFAAGAGFRPEGTMELMATMQARIPQSQEYGYWRTHPFFEQRVVSAHAREALLKVQEPEVADAFRERTQEALLAYRDVAKPEPPVVALLETSALVAWPRGPRADELRLQNLHAKRTEVEARPELYQDFGALLGAYERQAGEVRELTPGSPLLASLSTEMEHFRARLEQIYPRAVEVFRGGIYETEFLALFLSNYPAAPEVAEVALALGDAESRLGKETDAVTHYLQAWRLAPESPAGTKARAGLRQLAPRLNQLASLQQLADHEGDSELAALARTRLQGRVTTFESLANGDEYLDRFPNGEFVEPVTDRLDELADGLFGEVVLYQTVGDHVKALERINDILRHAPFSAAAQRLREKVVLPA